MKEFLTTESFSINFRMLLHDLGLDQKEAAEKLDCTQAAISQLINGQRLPSIETVLKITNTFHIKFERLFRK